jgi:hypothetical protein
VDVEHKSSSTPSTLPTTEDEGADDFKLPKIVRFPMHNRLDFVGRYTHSCSKKRGDKKWLTERDDEVGYMRKGYKNKSELCTASKDARNRSLENKEQEVVE